MAADGSILGGVVDNGTLRFQPLDSYVFAGVISGSGAVRQDGAGSTTLTATHLCGRAFINAGTLAAGADGNLGNVAGGITSMGRARAILGGFTSARGVTLNANGTFDTNGNNTGLREHCRSGGLIKIGVGLLTLSETTLCGQYFYQCRQAGGQRRQAIPDSSAVIVAAGASLGLVTNETIARSRRRDVLKTALAGP